MRNKISRYEENQVDRFLYDLYLLWGGNLDEELSKCNKRQERCLNVLLTATKPVHLFNAEDVEL